MGFKKIVKRCYEHTPEDSKPLLGLLAKLFEEGGELSEATLKYEGYLRHKEMKEEPVGEVADVILCALAIHARMCAQDGLTIAEAIDELEFHLDRKMTKWESIPPALVPDIPMPVPPAGDLW